MSGFTKPDIQTDHFTSHSALLSVYEKLFTPIKGTKDSILEIGVNDGGGIKMYSLFFPNAKAFAMDILPTPVGLKDDVRIKYFSRNAYTQESIKLMQQLGNKFALLIDDGPHTLQSQVWFCRYYPQLLASDGIAVVEDIQEPGYTDSMAAVVPAGFHSAVIDLRHINHRYDDLLFAIWPKP